MGYKMKNSLGNLLNKTDMSKLRSKQSRASKGVSEHQHFSKQGTQGDEPKVEYNMEKSPMNKGTRTTKGKDGLTPKTKDYVNKVNKKVGMTPNYTRKFNPDAKGNKFTY